MENPNWTSPANVSLQAKLGIAIDALKRIASGECICVSYEYDPKPTADEVAVTALDEIASIEYGEY